MPTWNQLAVDNLTAAQLLAEEKLWRSSVSRAYYAVFAALTPALKRDADFPAGRDAPAHATLPLLIRSYLSQVHLIERRRLMSDVRELYENRVTADYRASRTVDRATARRCLVLAQRVMRMMETTRG